MVVNVFQLDTDLNEKVKKLLCQILLMMSNVEREHLMPGWSFVR